MKPNGRRAWRKWLKSQRKHDKDSWAANIGACLGRAAYARRHRGTDAGQGLPDVVPTVSATPFTARSLVGMTMGARKRAYRAAVAELEQAEVWRGDVVDRSRLRISERLRPCPGCPQCTDDPLRIVKALSRRMKLRMEIHRCNSSIIPSKFDYLAMLQRPGPAWNPVCGFGPMRQDAVRALCDVILREGAEEFQIPWCDGSGVLPARKAKR